MNTTKSCTCEPESDVSDPDCPTHYLWRECAWCSTETKPSGRRVLRRYADDDDSIPPDAQLTTPPRGAVARDGVSWWVCGRLCEEHSAEALELMENARAAQFDREAY